MTVQDMHAELAERELETLARTRVPVGQPWDEESPGDDERQFEIEQQETEALKLLEKAYAICGWEDLAADLVVLNKEEEQWRRRARLTLYHLPAVKDNRCGKVGLERQQLRKKWLATSIREMECVLTDCRPCWDGFEDDVFSEQWVSARRDALYDLMARFNIEELVGLHDIMRTELPHERYKWSTARARLMDAILPMIRNAIGVEAEGVEDPNAPIRLNSVTILDDFRKWNDGLKTRPLPQQASKTLRFLYTSKAFSADSGKTNQQVGTFVVQECNSKAGPDWRIRKNAFNSGKLPELYEKVIGRKQVKYGQSDIYWLKLADSQ